MFDVANDIDLIKSGIASTKEIAIIGQAVRVMPAILASYVCIFEAVQTIFSIC